ncbi:MULTISPECIES: lysylphosphatidylglycerol synthase domain-containing protein [Roseomonadaceae]|uniref:Lysylphosphatidylglycerol synthetase family protein n=1 Tax=Falsiroseomonas oleicola TaxID=2801474 RepID=A0ABS6H7V4_9PROT|nr:lysylphosphatidylglycerol synthase domain-containing protein [Roseomonas oleicola]MBU8544033.1 lysylphosphatidylglycerol synthetase family protein [Roseomonas oleicola]
MKKLGGLLRRHGVAGFGVLLLIAAIWVVQKEFRSLSMADIRNSLAAIPPLTLWIAAGWTLLAYAVLTIYDRLGSVYAGYPVSYARTSLASFCAYTLAHNLGFAAVSGAAVRYRFYAAWGLPPLAIAKVVAFTSLTFGLGGFALGGLVLLVEPEVVPGLGEHVPHWAMNLIGLAMWGLVIAYVTLSRIRSHVTIFKHRIDLPGFRMAVAQTTLASVDVAVTAMIFYVLLPEAEGLTFLRFLGIYVAAYTAGIAASLPGGIGVFDGAILIGLAPWLTPAQVVGALLLFRLYYYIVPLFLAGILFAGFEIAQRRHVLVRFAAEQRVADALEVPAIAGLVGLGGALLIFVGALPAGGTAVAEWAGYEAAVASHFAASLIGSLLLVMGYGLLRRLTLAWGAGIVLLIVGALICWLRADGWWIWGAFLLVAGLLAAMRSAFYRSARLMREPLAGASLLPLVVVGLCALMLALVSYGGKVATESWWEVVASPLAPDSLRFSVGLAAVLLLVAVVRLLRPARLVPEAWSLETRARLRALGAEAPELADGAVFGESGRAGFAFVRRNGLWLGLGDPAGEERDRVSAIWRFRDMCERAGVDAAFWRVGPGLLRVYGDIGLTAFPVGALGPGDGPRFLVCRAEKDLELLAPLLPPR